MKKRNLKKEKKNKKNSQKVIKRYKLKPWVYFLLLFLCLFLFSISIYNLIGYYMDSKKMDNVVEGLDDIIIDEYVGEENDESIEIVNPPEENNNTSSEKTGDYWEFIKTPFLNVDFTELLKKNKDTVAWININNTNINYPVVQASDNEYYLDKAFDGSSNRAGWLFMDYKNDSVNWDDNTVIYGHSMLNSTMFGTLIRAYEPYWYNNKNNMVIRISTPTENTLWQIFSIYKIKAEGYYITTSFITDEAKLNFLNTIKSRSIKDFGVILNEKDKVLTLSTCADASGNNRLVVHAKLIKRENR